VKRMAGSQCDRTVPPVWPNGSRFAFTIFDDPDGQPLAQSRVVYSNLEDLGFLTTKAIWLLEPETRNSGGETCQSREFLTWSLDLQSRGFEIGYHNGAPGALRRVSIIRSLDLFRDYFGHDPVSMANHYNDEAIYWGGARLSGRARTLYNAVTVGRKNRFFGHVEGHPCFWGDVCRERVSYCRNFAFRDINTLGACPQMPYTDPDRPYVRRWFACAEGANCPSFLRQIAERRQDELEEQGGACILYTHFGHGFMDRGHLNGEVKRLMKRLTDKKGWFVPVSALLDYLASRQLPGYDVLRPADRSRLEWRWLSEKLIHGTS
jgi:hypothetical protein